MNAGFQNAMHGNGSPAMGGPFSAHDPPLTPRLVDAPMISACVHTVG